jgi:hypothetical protein
LVISAAWQLQQQQQQQQQQQHAHGTRNRHRVRNHEIASTKGDHYHRIIVYHYTMVLLDWPLT